MDGQRDKPRLNKSHKNSSNKGNMIIKTVATELIEVTDREKINSKAS